MIVYISIGNSDDKLSQREWAKFIANVETVIVEYAVDMHGNWYSQSDSPYQNACWCIQAPSDFPSLMTAFQDELMATAKEYRQDSIAWAEVRETIFLRGV